MRKIYFLFTFLFLSHFAKAQDPDAFVMTFEVSGSNLGITVPIVQDDDNNYTVDFGDGTILTNQTGNASHTYNTAGIYTVSLTGTFGHIRFLNTYDSSKLKLKSIEQWGTNQWKSMESAFRACSNLILNATDDPDLSQVTDMSYIFSGASSFNQSINNWDVSNVTNMENMFFNASSFNQPLNNWDVSNVTNMMSMFYGASSFNQPLNNWDVSNVTNMYFMFMGASSFNQPLNDWDVSNVINMGWMFRNASSFNQPLNSWDVSSVVNTDLMFDFAVSFNQPLNDWNVSNVTNMNYMFIGASSFNQPLNDWDVSNVTNMGYMFYEATSFNQDLSNWDFNPNVSLDEFLNDCGLNTINYDLLLQRFVTLELENKTLGANGLQYCDENVRDYLINNLGWTITGDNSDNCGDNTIIGSIIYDENNNGCDADDLKINKIWVTATNGTTTSTTLSANEEYILNVYEGTHTISLNVLDYFSYSPGNSTVIITGSGNNETLDFCLTPNQTIQDLNITILPINEARPGFKAKYQLIVQNIGTQTINNVSVSLDFDNTMQSFVSAVPNPSSTTANQLNFDIASLSPFSSTVINFTMQTFTPPTVNGDDILNFTATVSPNTDDYTPNDNTFELEQIVVNSYDPNDKQVLQGSEIHIDDVNEYLHYLIRFQNTGTASAIHVRIEDELHESLDWNTIQILNSSHNYRVEIKDGNQVAFIFNNINLPYEDEDEEGSNGFIAYKIKPIAGTQLGDFIIGNEAYIYFDYNLPIITNTTSTEVVDETSNVSVPSLNNLISVYPNPTNGILHLSSKENIIIEEVKIYNLQGRELFGSTTNQQTINIENLSAGIYLMNIKTNQGSISKRVIKK